jgi:4-amino-4-deoxy-L-arabinose transferase-like glycosyltransferase
MADGRQRWRAEWGVLLAAALLWLPVLDARDLWSPDEPRIAQIAEELRAGYAGPTSWILLHHDGVPYTQKPPLYYWLAAGLGAPDGRVSAWAARAPSAVAALASLALTMSIARRLFGPRYAAWSGLLLLTSFRFSDLAQRAQLDLLLTACELGAWLAFILWRQEAWPPHRALRAMHVALGAALLAKGPVGLLPLIGAAALSASERRAADLRSLFMPRLLLLSFGPLLLWSAAALTLAPPGFFEEAVVDNLLKRVGTGTSHIRPAYYYLYQLPLEFLPGALLLPWAIAAAWRSRRTNAPVRWGWSVLAWWVMSFLVLFSLSAGKRGIYMAPALPGLAIGCAVVLVDGLSRARRIPLGAGWALAAAAIGLGALGIWTSLAPDALGAVPDTITIPAGFGRAVAVVMGSALLCAGFLWRRPPLVRAAICGGALIGLQACVFNLLYPALDPERSLRPVAEAALELARPGERIGVVHHPSLIPGLTYYSGGTPGRYEDLPDHAAIREFLREERGQVLISEIRRQWALEPAPFPTVSRFRSGNREIKLLAPRGRVGIGRHARPHKPANAKP